MNPETPDTTPPDPDLNAGDVDDAVTEGDRLRQELTRQADLYQHLAADFDNFKRRSRLESEARAAAQKDAFVVELLPILDNFERALAASSTPTLGLFRQGVEMMFQQLQALLRQNGIESADIVGRPFDPQEQEALSGRCDPARPDHTVLEVFQRGYRRGAKVLRPAKVVVNDLSQVTSTSERAGE
jgi:molecular chaperone GrpE